ncbi:hypothetical protein E2C01_060434 [Portunus trituberculatus]|uniref:Uncharacterized protein n=1 Tax=Portunus trituberculatus TaxID=210409 RepID=A0A5B7HAH5_PORTR|nr:hypothetical protein [Portunus trituberculatus]
MFHDFWDEGKINPNKFMRERRERIGQNYYQTGPDSTQELEQEVEKVIRLGRFSEGGRRAMKI